MKRLIVQTLEKSSIAMVAILLLVGLIGGYASGGIGAAILGFLVCLVIAVLFFGILFVQLEMNENLRAIRGRLESPSE